MSYRTLAFTSANPGMMNASSAREQPQGDTLPSLAWPSAKEAARPGIIASRLDEFALPSGIASLEHWLDLNA